MKKSMSGFTIVELLIVIVVIGTLATIGLVSYSAMTKRARTAQTVTAGTQWVKTLQLYKIRNGQFPDFPGCLGTGYRYNSDDRGTSGVGQCYQSSSTIGVTSATVGPTSKTLSEVLQPYATSQPTPGFVTAANSSVTWKRGIYYYNDTSIPKNAMLDVVLDGQISVASCPKLAEKTATSITQASGNTVCTYNLGLVVGYE